MSTLLCTLVNMYALLHDKGGRTRLFYRPQILLLPVACANTGTVFGLGSYSAGVEQLDPT